tara:strand:- start:7338 stop:9335 length:1998 start_codon:yes stop_codon:yes gene_type:complete
MALKFYGALSLDGQQLKDASLEVRSSVYSTGGEDYEGRIIFVQASDGNTLAGTLQYKSAAAGVATWTSLSGTGAVTSIAANTSSGLRFSLVDNSALATDDQQTIEVDYSTADNIVLIPGNVSDEVMQGTALTGVKFIYSNSSNLVKHADAVHLQSVLQAGVSSADTNDQAGDSNVEVFAAGFIADSVGEIDFSADLRAEFPEGTAEIQKKFYFLKATSATGTEWAQWIPLSNAQYRLDVDNVAAVSGVSGVGTKINFTESTDGGSTFPVTHTVTLVPKMSTPDTGAIDIPRQIDFTTINTGTLNVGLAYAVGGNMVGGTILSLSDDLKIDGTLTVGTGVFTSDGNVSFEGPETSFTTLNASGGSSDFEAEGTSEFVKITGAVSAFTDAPNPQSWVNKAYVDYATTLTNQITYAGEYNATLDPPTSNTVGDLYVVTTPGNGASTDNYVTDGGFWSQAQSGGWLRNGDMIIAIHTSGAAGYHWALVQGNIDIAEVDVLGVARFHDGTDAGFADGGWADLDSWDNAGKPQPRGYTLAASIANEATHAPIVTVQKFGKLSAIGNRDGATPMALDHRNNFSTTTTFTDAVQVKYLERKVHGTLPNTTDNPYRLTHSLGTKDVIVDVYDATSGDTVFAEVTRTNNSYIDLSGIDALSAGALRVTVHAIVDL